MSSQLATTGASLPAPAGGVVVPGVPAAGEYGATPLPPAAPVGDDPRLVAALQQVISIVTQLIAARQAQGGAAAIQGGGASAPATGSFGGMMAIGSSSMGSVGTAPGSPGVSGGGGLIGGSGGYNVRVGDTGGMGVIGGGGAGVPSTSYGVGPSLIGSTPAPAAAASATPVVGGGGATPQVDMRRVSGTPQPGGLVDAVIKAATPHATAAKSEGAWTVLTDAGGAQLQAHVHGPWSSHPTRLVEGIQRGFVQVHLHPDGTLHLHDVA